MLYTLGTSNRTFEEFLDLFKEHGIEVGVDIRSFPSSRFPHFMKECFQRSLESEEIDYHYLGKELGGFRKGGYVAYMETDSSTLEVKDDYLNVQVAERNIKVAEKAIEQAEENLRMNEERYKFQVSTQTDVIIAVTLLAQAQTNYYGALSDFNVAKVQLERSMGRM